MLFTNYLPWIVNIFHTDDLKLKVNILPDVILHFNHTKERNKLNYY